MYALQLQSVYNYLLHAVRPLQLRFARLSQSVDLTNYLGPDIFQVDTLSLQSFQPTWDKISSGRPCIQHQKEWMYKVKRPCAFTSSWLVVCNSSFFLRSSSVSSLQSSRNRCSSIFSLLDTAVSPSASAFSMSAVWMNQHTYTKEYCLHGGRITMPSLESGEGLDSADGALLPCARTPQLFSWEKEPPAEIDSFLPLRSADSPGRIDMIRSKRLLQTVEVFHTYKELYSKGEKRSSSIPQFHSSSSRRADSVPYWIEFPRWVGRALLPA